MTIPIGRKLVALALMLGGFACMGLAGQRSENLRRTMSASTKATLRPATLTRDEGLTVIATALDAHRPVAPDCSHLVHAIYDRAGFSYPYADSDDLYRGAEHFRRVKHPQIGDLIVWKGHVGIVVSPARHIFFSDLSHGPGTDRYDAKYWKRRGLAKFYRYVKTETARNGDGPE